MVTFPATSNNPDDTKVPNHAWYYDTGDNVPMGVPVNAPQASGVQGGRTHPKKAIAHFKIEADIERNVANKQTCKPRPIGSQSRHRAPQDAASDDEGQAYCETSDGTTDDDEVDAMIENSELAASLSSKAIPQTRKRAQKRKRSKSPLAPSSEPSATAKKSCPVTVEEAKDEDAPFKSPNATLGRKRNPIYYFYEEVPLGADGKTGEGSRHFKCCHGNRKVLTITRAMKFSLNGLVGHLKSHFPMMYRLYELLKVRSDPPTQDQLDIASAKKKLDGPAASAYASQLEKTSENIVDAFQRQGAQAARKFDQEVFEKLLAECIVACGQPFNEVDKGPFRELLQYTHRPSGKPLHIPHRTAIQARVMKMGQERVDSIKQMFSELECQVSVSLDSWTSSNRYAFLAIVAHYITNDGELEEMLIDFHELVGEHSSENMAEAVWQTLETYGLLGRVIAFVMDNTSNNDTMVTAFEARCREHGIYFSASHSRLRCMPHTCHLAVLKLLEDIGVISKSDSRKASARGGTYQDVVTIPVSRNYDDSGVVEDEELDNEEMADEVLMDNAGKAAPKAVAVNKLRRLIRAIRSNPQQRQAWLRVAAIHQQSKADDLKKQLMLILDVPTRWSSTHQMLRRALDNRKAIDVFLARNHDFRDHKLSEHEWEGVILITGWLESFRSATTQMSTMKRSMVSTTHAIFRGLQDQIKTDLSDLPGSTSFQLILGLTAAHTKLNDYNYKFIESPLYTWAALLDPRISYDGMKLDYEDDISLTEYLESAKLLLHTYFSKNYAGKHVPPSHTSSAHSSTTMAQSRLDTSPKVNFTARYRKAPRTSANELEDYFKLPREDFETCDPIKWWLGRRSRFPNLFVFARDLLAIPGSAVAVERIFPGGRDAISLQRASLQPETIRTLMLAKQRLHIAQRAIGNGSQVI